MNNITQLTSLPGEAIVGVLLDGLDRRARGILDSATQNADYLIAKVAVEARIAIENARDASRDVINLTFDNLKGERHQLIANIDRVLGDVQDGVMSGAEALTKLQEGGQQIAQVLDLQGYRSYVTRYSPAVVFPRSFPNPESILIVVRGINLDEANAKLRIGGKELAPLTTVKQELTFEVPTTDFQFQANTSSLYKATLQYTSVAPGFWKRLFGRIETASRDVVILVLPEQLGTFRFESTVGTTSQERKSVRMDLEQFKGDNEDQSRVFQAEPGWEIDLSTLSHEQFGEGGGNSYCIGFLPEASSKLAVTYRAHVGHIKAGFSDGPGFVNCRIGYDLVRTVIGESPGPSLSEVVQWAADKPIPFPAGMKSFSITLRTFDGRERTFSGDGHDKFFDVVREANRLVIRPVVPADLA